MLCASTFDLLSLARLPFLFHFLSLLIIALFVFQKLTSSFIRLQWSPSSNASLSSALLLRLSLQDPSLSPRRTRTQSALSVSVRLISTTFQIASLTGPRPRHSSAKHPARCHPRAQHRTDRCIPRSRQLDRPPRPKERQHHREPAMYRLKRQCRPTAARCHPGIRQAVSVLSDSSPRSLTNSHL